MNFSGKLVFQTNESSLLQGGDTRMVGHQYRSSFVRNDMFFGNTSSNKDDFMNINPYRDICSMNVWSYDLLFLIHIFLYDSLSPISTFRFSSL